MILDDTAYKNIEELSLGEKSLEFSIKGTDMGMDWFGKNDAPDLDYGEAIRAQGSMLRELHSILKRERSQFWGVGTSAR